MGRGRESERLDRAARTMEVLRRCPLAIAQRLVHCAIAFQLLCWTESLRECPLHRCWRTTWTTRSKRRPTCSAQLHLPTHDLFWTNVRVQLHLPPLRSLDLLISLEPWYLKLGPETYYTKIKRKERPRSSHTVVTEPGRSHTKFNSCI